MAADRRAPGDRFDRLVGIMRTLRGKDGCPWDREQTLESLRPFLLEEAYEVVGAIDRGDLEDLRQEIGDLLFEAVFLAQVAGEGGAFTVSDSLDAICDKLVRRHPHVFGETTGERADAPTTATEVVERWEVLKAREREGSERPHTTLGGVPRALPALLRAFEIGNRVAAVGFDWDRAADVMSKIEEEVAELGEQISRGSAGVERAEEEMGDLLFSIANLSRKLGIEPEAALRKANDKFTARFQAMEAEVAASGRTLQGMSLAEMEDEWQRIKVDGK